MKRFTRSYNIKPFSDEAFDTYFGGLRPCVYDIETNGLSPGRSKIILTAMLIPHENGVTVTQFLAEDPFEEDLVLSATMDHIRDSDIGYLVTYNGASFDVPFTNTRLDILGLPYHMRHYDLDMYRLLKKYTCLPDELSSMSQKSVESYLGFYHDRKDVISGRESVKMYNEYVKTGDSILEKVILTHNREDVLQLYKILSMMVMRNFPEMRDGIDLDIAMSDYGFPAAEGSLTVRAGLKKTCLKITGEQKGDAINSMKFKDFADDYTAEFSAKTSLFTIEIPVQSHQEARFLDLSTHMDAETIENMQTLCDSDAIVNDYLILSEGDRTNHMELNIFSRLFTERQYETFIK